MATMTARLTAGTPAPEFTLPDSEGQPISLSDYAGSSVILYFYPAAMTPGCTTQAVDFSAAVNDFRDAGYEILGVSPDSVERLSTFRKKSDVGFPLLSDADREVMNAYGAYGTKKLYGKEIEGVLRSTFVIDVTEAGEGVTRLAQYNVKATGHVARLRRELGL